MKATNLCSYMEDELNCYQTDKMQAEYQDRHAMII